MLKIAKQRATWGLALFLFSLSADYARAQVRCEPGTPQLIIYHAGSLTAAFVPIEKLFTQQTGVCVVDVPGGSVDAARRVTAGQQPCDIFASADYAVIELLLKPARFADYDILFAEGEMVLAYTTESKYAHAIAAANSPFSPPDDIPAATADWYAQLTRPGVAIGGSHPFLDPSGYRADFIFQLAQDHYDVPNLYNALLAHYSINKATDKLGKTYDYQFIYEHSALAAHNADTTKTFRYVRLPRDISLSAPELNKRYGKHGIVIPGLQVPTASPTARLPATRVTWGLTVLKTARNRDNALRFLQLLFSNEGAAILAEAGPKPVNPPIVSRRDFAYLPTSLKSMVRQQAAMR